MPSRVQLSQHRVETEAASTLRSFPAVSANKGCFEFAALHIETYEIKVLVGSDLVNEVTCKTGLLFPRYRVF